MIEAITGVSQQYKAVKIICPRPCYEYGIPGWHPCIEKRCKSYRTEKYLTGKKGDGMSCKKDTPYCKAYEMDLPVIFERVRTNAT